MKRKSLMSTLLMLVVMISSQGLLAQEKVNSKNALKHYVNTPDEAFDWEVKDSTSIANVKIYNILLTSQHWQQYTWKHQLAVVIPNNIEHDGALLFVSGGHNDPDNQMPNMKDLSKDKLSRAIAMMSIKNKAAVAILKQVPNEPIFNGRTEDEIISYTYHKYEEDTTQYTWPLLLPMVKSAVKAMDVVQTIAKKNTHHDINRFVVTGASKRGWTTWLTAASQDPRVVAIAPMVIDILNMPVNLKHQLQAYGDFSVEIQDYVKLGITDGLTEGEGDEVTPEARALLNIVDPYSYRKSLKMPKLLMMGTNDPYWVIDNVKNYLPAIPGHNLLNYSPNAGHGLNGGEVALPALSAFFGITMKGGEYPTCTWTTKESNKQVKITIDATKDALIGAKLWYATSAVSDFREAKWRSKDVQKSMNVGKVKTSFKFPKKGYGAFYVDLIYQDPNGGEYTVSTRAFMTDTHHIL